MNVEPTELQGNYVTLEPLIRDIHQDDLIEAGSEANIFKWFLSISSPDDIPEFLEKAELDQQDGKALPFAIVYNDTGKAIGTTRFGSISREHRRVEIGWTWISPTYQRTGVNTESKFLLLSHAFENWECGRVMLKTDCRNTQSRRAIERLGAKKEGVLRKHCITDHGYRDTVVYSIVDSEWPSIKSKLKTKIE